MIQTLEDLEKVLKILRTQGVTSFKFNGLEISLGDLPSQAHSQSLQEEVNLEYPTQAELDRAVGLPVMGLEDPFLTYNEQPISTGAENSG